MSTRYTFGLKSLALLVFLFLVSCKDDEVKKENFVVNIEASLLSQSDYTAYAIISDEAGNTVAWTKIETGNTYALKAEAQYKDKTFSITEMYLDHGTTPYAYALTYAGLPAETTTWKFTNFSTASPTTRTAMKFNFSSLNTSVNTWVAPNTGSQYFMASYNVANGLSINAIGTSTYLFAATLSSNTSQARYRFFTNNNAGYTNITNNTIDLSQINQVIPMKALTAPAGTTSPGLTVTGILKTGTGAGTYVLPSLNSTSLTYDLGTMFDDYRYSYGFTKDRYRFTNASISTIDAEPLNFTLTTKTKSPASITYTTNGTGDVENIYYSYTTATNYGDWDIYQGPLATERTVTLPKVPAEILAQSKAIDPSLFYIQSFSVQDYKSMSGFSDYLAKRRDSGVALERKSAGITYDKL